MDLSPWLAGGFVVAEHRRKGIASALVGRIVEEARALGVARLYLYTPKAERLYARLGWDVLERTAYREMEVVIMTLEVTPALRPIDSFFTVRPTCGRETGFMENETNTNVTREKLIELLNEDLSREYQAIIAYVVYSQIIKGAAYMDIAQELEVHAKEELDHAIKISKQIDYLGGTPTVTPKPVKMSDKPEDLLRFDLDNENETVQHYRNRIRQAEALGEFALSETLRGIIVQEQEHQIDLADALGIDVPQTPKESKQKS